LAAPKDEHRSGLRRPLGLGTNLRSLDQRRCQTACALLGSAGEKEPALTGGCCVRRASCHMCWHTAIAHRHKISGLTYSRKSAR